MSGPARQSPDIEAEYANILRERGFMLPHHRLLATFDPDLFKASSSYYDELAMKDRALSRHDRKFVWVVILISMCERIPVHHLRQFMAAGGTAGMIETALRVAAFANGAAQYAFLAQEWGSEAPWYDRAEAYSAGLEALLHDAKADRGLVEIALAAAQTVHGRFWEVRHHIAKAYAHGVPEAGICEALSLTGYPGNMARFIKACQVWIDLINAEEVSASHELVAWAADPRQARVD